MRFGNPQYAWLFLGVIVIGAILVWGIQRRRAALERIASAPLLRTLTPVLSGHTWMLRGILFLLCYICMVAALMLPRFGSRMQKVEREGVDIIVALDISKSMLARDMKPDRFTRATHEIASFIDRLKGDRIGLVVFAGESFVQCPLTLDYGAAQLFLDAVNTDWIQVQGTAIGDAIRTATEAFVDASKKHKVLIVISDGEDHKGEALQAARQAGEQGVRMYTVGVGSAKGAPIALHGKGRNVVYKKDDNGNVVMTRLDPAMLEKIATAGNGAYFHAGTRLHMQHIYEEIMKMEKKAFEAQYMRSYKEQYHIFTAAALVFLVLSMLAPVIARRRHNHAAPQARRERT
jgi:Ca-activated chloride channel family protein